MKGITSWLYIRTSHLTAIELVHLGVGLGYLLFVGGPAAASLLVSGDDSGNGVVVVGRVCDPGWVYGPCGVCDPFRVLVPYLGCHLCGRVRRLKGDVRCLLIERVGSF